MQVAVPNTCQSSRSSVLAQRFAYPQLGELVLADDALGLDPQQYVHAMAGPFGDLGGIDAAVQPRGQASAAQVVRPTGALDHPDA